MKFRMMTSAAAIMGLAFGLSVGASNAADSITVVSWGGAYTNSQVKAYHEPFTKKTDIVSGPSGLFMKEDNPFLNFPASFFIRKRKRGDSTST